MSFSQTSGDVACLDEETANRLANQNLTVDALQDATSHLEACALCREWVSELVRPDDEPRLEPQADPLTATIVGRYQLIERVGTGGAGYVYRAHDPVLDRFVALKILREIDSQWRTCMIVEARALARINHSNVVAIHDAGEAENEVYIAMEYVDAGSLRDYVRETDPGVEVLWRLLTDSARGISALPDVNYMSPLTTITLPQFC